MLYVLISDGSRSVICPAEQHDEDQWPSRPTPFRPSEGWERRSDPIEAHSWISAKAVYGFELTPLQTSLLSSLLSEQEATK